MFSDQRNPKKIFRQGVGIVLFNKNKHIFIGQRRDSSISAWQMPQGGIKAHETPFQAAVRETMEEVGTDKIEHVGETKQNYSYTFPAHFRQGAFWGQTQKWFLFFFEGDDQDIQIEASESPEFRAWRWARHEQVLAGIVPFKKNVYVQVLREFVPKIKAF